MTWKQFAENYLVDRGMSEDQAEAVVTLAIGHEVFAFLRGRWHKPVGDYPENVQSTVILCLRAVAIEWIEANCPEASLKAAFKH